MKIYQSKNVYEAALERIEYIYREFPNVVVSVSGGKDSTVVLNLSIEVARKLGRLPVIARFLDQEAEWRGTIEYMRKIRDMPEVELRWYQIEFKISNSTSLDNDFLYCWKEGEDWIRPKEPNALTDSYGITRFHEFMSSALDYEYPNDPACAIAGVRADESPQRFKAMLSSAYKHITYGSRDNPKLNHYSFYPIYDWTTKDVWKYIASNKLPYNEVYDLMHRKGVPIQKMRISNLTHETATQSLLIVQDIDGGTWDDVVGRLESANAIKHLKGAALCCPKELPFMFRSWREYRDYLLENLINDEDKKAMFKHKFGLEDKKLIGTHKEEELYKVEVSTIINNDYSLTGLKNFMTAFDQIELTKRRMRKNDKQAEATPGQ